MRGVKKTHAADSFKSVSGVAGAASGRGSLYVCIHIRIHMSIRAVASGAQDTGRD